MEIDGQYLTMALFVLTLAGSCRAHGSLWEPPGRSTMGKRGFPVPINWNDNGLRCGGSRTSCGVCGDPPNGPFDNEAGGKYATGIIARTYTEGQNITVKIDVTANHLGWFEFHLCPNNDVNKKVTEECLMKNVLQLTDGSYRYDLQSGHGMVDIGVTLPGGLTCSQCVFRWKWITIITNAEQFYGCSDISIVKQNSPSVNPTMAVATQRPTAKTTQKTTERPTTATQSTQRYATSTAKPITTTPESTTTTLEPTTTKLEPTIATLQPTTKTYLTTKTEAPITTSPIPPKTTSEGTTTAWLCEMVSYYKYDLKIPVMCKEICRIVDNNCPNALCEC